MNKLFLLLTIIAVFTSAAATAEGVPAMHLRLATGEMMRAPGRLVDPEPRANSSRWPKGEYKSLGTGTMTDDMLTAFYNYLPVTYEVEILQSVKNPDFYRVEAPYGENFAEAMRRVNGVELADSMYDARGIRVLDIDASDPENVFFARTMTGCDLGCGEMYIGIPAEGKVSLRNGCFTATPRGVTAGDDDGSAAMNTRRKFSITFPGAELADYSLALTLDSVSLSTRRVTGNISAGSGVRRVKYGIFPDMQEDNMKSAVGKVAAGNDIFDMNGDFAYEMSDKCDKETLVVVAFDEADNPVASAYASYYYVSGDDSGWTDAGTVTITENLFEDLVDIPSATLTCTLQRNEANPGMLRLVDPFASHPAYTASSHNYLYINAKDPGCIFFEESPAGIDTDFGPVSISSAIRYYLDAGYRYEDLRELDAGGTAGTQELLFPSGSILISMPGYDNGTRFMAGPMTITLPYP